MPVVIHDTEINADVLDRIKDESAFYNFVFSQYRHEARRAGLMPKFTKPRLFYAYEAWIRDVQRMPPEIGDGDGTNEADHFKQCGFLAYWLRRFAPAYSCEKTREDAAFTPQEKEFRELLFKYWVEYLAFGLGARICLFFEKNKQIGTATLPKMTAEYLETVCYFMKYKHVSPHGLTLIYKSLFI